MLIIDRFEGDIAVCEASDLTMVEIPRSALPPEAGPGSILIPLPDGGYRLDAEIRRQRRSIIETLEQKIFKKDKGR